MLGNRANRALPSVPQKGRGGLIALPQFFDDRGGDAELGLREALKNVIELNQSRGGGVSQNTCRAGDPQSQRVIVAEDDQ